MTLFSTFFIIGTFNGLVLATILFLNSSRKLDKNIWLGTLLLIISTFLFNQYLIEDFGVKTLPHLIGGLIPLLFLIGPLFYFFMTYEIEKKPTWKHTNYLHFLPAIGSLMLLLPFYLKSGTEKYSIYIEGHHYFPNKGLYYWCFGLLLLFYSYKSLGLIYQHSIRTNKKIGKNKSHKWIKHFVWLFSSISICFFITLTILSFTWYHHSKVFLSTFLVFSFLIHFVGFWSIKESKFTSVGSSSNSKPILSNKRILAIKNEIIHLLENEEVYKNDNIDSKFFCNKLSLNSKYLSHIINNEFNCSLTFLVNSYRITEAKSMIKSEDYSHLNFLGIAMEVGFNTKNTFTRVFKRHAGMTPTEYKNRILLSA
ncbi:helix-turn-helix domain-containing protein [uncultured Psychroserpens sp.]|uniref:helix-turn-helix domain-containing protein n=1 Tax=uncultured Psychroserpens sp. TaxID=255436 RepID=UPI00261D979B|nr:helix-turn-helix domain-containing protein [uncultured Psychroserpens sp.]